jgi:hypothetical protein
MREKDFARYIKLVGTMNGFSAASCTAMSSFIIFDPSRVSRYPKTVSKKSSISERSELMGIITPRFTRI